MFWTGSKGWGIRTLEKLPANTFLCQYVGEIRLDDSTIIDEPYVTDLDDATKSKPGDPAPLVIDAKLCGKSPSST